MTIRQKITSIKSIHRSISQKGSVLTRSAYGAAVVVVSAEDDKEKKKEQHRISGSAVILIAGGKGNREGRTMVLDTVEVFDPDAYNQAQICSHRLSTARYACGAFSVGNDTMCILGGKDRRAKYLASVELVTPSSSSLLPNCNFDLPCPMASFGVAVVGDKVLLLGGKTIDSTLDSVFQADLSHFVLASKSQLESASGQKSIWERVDTMGSVPPCHSFSLVADEVVCWIIGGFDGEKLLQSIGMYHSKRHQFLYHPASLSVPRSGLSSFALGKNILVSGGVTPSSGTVTAGQAAISAPMDDFSREQNGAAEVLARGDGIHQSEEAFYGLPNLIDSAQNDQFIVQLGFKAFAIGHFDFSDGTPKPTSEISTMDLVPLRGFLGDGTFDAKALISFPKPFVPDAPINPAMSTDLKKLKKSVDSWKEKFDENEARYRQRISAASATAQMLHDEAVAALKTEIHKTTEKIASLKPDRENSRDKEDVNRMIEEKRIAFQHEKAMLRRGLKDRIRNRNKEFEAVCAEESAIVRKLETTVSDCNTHLQEYHQQIEKEFSAWISSKHKDVAIMDSIVAGKAPMTSSESVDVTEDRKKILKVLTGIDSEAPAEVSSEYGKQCTNNFDPKNKIGTGGFGVVYQGNDIALKRTLAFKRVSVLVTSPKKLDAILRTFKREISVRPTSLS